MTIDHIQAGELATISSINPTKRDPERRMIRVGNEVIATLDRRVIEAMDLHTGMEWTEELATHVTAAARRDRLRRYAINALGRRALSEGELIDRLKRRDAGDAQARAIAGEMRELGIIDDESYAEAVVRSVLSSRPAGARLLELKLRQKRIDPATARAVIDRMLQERDPAEDAAILAAKKLRTMPQNLSNEARRRRIYGQLARRGFDPATCAKATQHAMREVDARSGE